MNIPHNELQLSAEVAEKIFPTPATVKNPEEYREKHNNLVHEILVAGGRFKNCYWCNYFNHDKDVCKLKNNKRPPARIIIKGCKHFTNDIPF